MIEPDKQLLSDEEGPEGGIVASIHRLSDSYGESSMWTYNQTA